MTPKEAIKVLRAAFAALTPARKKRLRAHAKAKTRILCGENAGLWLHVDAVGERRIFEG